MVLDERYLEEPQVRSPPVFDLKVEPVETGEGEPAKFLVKVGGFPRPRVSWWINGSLVVSVSCGLCVAHLPHCATNYLKHVLRVQSCANQVLHIEHFSCAACHVP